MLHQGLNVGRVDLVNNQTSLTSHTQLWTLHAIEYTLYTKHYTLIAIRYTLLIIHKELELLRNNEAKPMQKCHQTLFYKKKLMQILLIPMLIEEYQIICSTS